MSDSKKLQVFAPAKVNLFLHLIRKKQDGYHDLQSLVSFADIGDYIDIEPADDFSFNVTGPFAQKFNAQEQNAQLESSNLVVRAARALSQTVNKSLKVKITLTKSLPLAAGLGGGSSDAAATLWGLQNYWNLDPNPPYLMPLMIKLGADVPVCYRCQPTLVEGIGDRLTQAPDFNEIPILLINPMVSCPTAQTFMHHNGIYKDKISLPDHFPSVFDLVTFLQSTDNDLYASASSLIPEIGNVINALDTQGKSLFSRMTGSGASCFALYETIDQANQAKKEIEEDNPDWWLATGWLNRPERY